MEKGTVKWFDAVKGYGFIARGQGGDIFVHYKHIAGGGYRKLDEGDHVEFEVEQTGKGRAATEVRVVEVNPNFNS